MFLWLVYIKVAPHSPYELPDRSGVLGEDNSKVLFTRSSPLMIEPDIVTVVMGKDHALFAGSEAKLPIVVVFLVVIACINTRQCVITVPA